MVASQVMNKTQQCHVHDSTDFRRLFQRCHGAPRNMQLFLNYSAQETYLIQSYDCGCGQMMRRKATTPTPTFRSSKKTISSFWSFTFAKDPEKGRTGLNLTFRSRTKTMSFWLTVLQLHCKDEHCCVNRTIEAQNVRTMLLSLNLRFRSQRVATVVFFKAQEAPDLFSFCKCFVVFVCPFIAQQQHHTKSSHHTH